MKKKASIPVCLDRLWNFFASVRLTVALLLTLAVTSVIGTLIPQNEDPAAYFRKYGESLYRILHGLDIFDMYHSWWFQFLLLMLTINIIVCSADRLSATWRIIFNKKPSFVLSSFRKLSRNAEFVVEGSSASRLREMFEPYLSKSFTYVRTDQTDEGFFIFAEKGRWTRFGAYIVHISVVLLLLGGLAGSIFGFEGFVNISEGEMTRHIRLRKSGEIKKLDFDIRCDAFNVSFYDTGAPKEYRSSLTLLEGGEPVLKKDIIVNDPLRHKGINIFQSSYQSLPLSVDYLKGKEIALNIKSNVTGMTYPKQVIFGEPFGLPEDFGTIVIRDASNSYEFRGHNIGKVFIATLTSRDGSPMDVILPPFSSFDRMRGGDFFVTITDHPTHYYTGLQVTKDPGVLIVYTGFVVMIIGIFVTFFMSHQKICVEVTESEGKLRVMVSGTANKNKMGMGIRIRKLAQKLISEA